MTLLIVDAIGTQRNLSTTVNPNDAGLVGAHCVTDPVTGTKANVNSFGAVQVSGDGTKPTYRYSTAFNPAANPTDLIVIQGSATKTGRIKFISIYGISASSAQVEIFVGRRSSANSGGTLNAFGGGTGLDPNDVTSTIIPKWYTANATSLGTLVGFIDIGLLWLPVGSSFPPSPLRFDFCKNQDKACILRGTADYIVIGGNSAAFPTSPSLYFTIEIEEDNS